MSDTPELIKGVLVNGQIHKIDYNALANKPNIPPPVDLEPVYSAISAKQDKLYYDQIPLPSSSKIIDSGHLFNILEQMALYYVEDRDGSEDGGYTVLSNNTALIILAGGFESKSTIGDVDALACLTIGNDAFAFCSNLGRVNFPRCKVVNDSAFYECSLLSEVYLPECEYLGDDAFNACSSLSEISLPECSRIGRNAFWWDENLQYIYAPKCEYIEENAFVHCTSLAISNCSFPECSFVGRSALTGTQVTVISFPKLEAVNEGNFQYRTISYFSLPECTRIGRSGFTSTSFNYLVDLPKCSYIGKSAFSEAKLNNGISLPECIEIDESAFYKAKVSNIELPKCTSIGYGAFYSCSYLESITFGAPISLGYFFYSNSKLSNIYLNMSVVCPTILNDPAYYFISSTKLSSNFQIHVPTSLYNDYISDSRWTDLSSYIVSM